MTLRLSGEALGVQELVEAIAYTPGVQDSGDLEAATAMVTATAKPATPDYATSLTVPAPADGRVEVLRTALRLQVTVDSFGGEPAATALSATVEVNDVEKLAAVSFTSTGDGFASVDITAGVVLGASTSLKVYLWVDQGEAVVSAVRLWLGVGSVSTGQPMPVARIHHAGALALSARVHRAGTGAPYIYLAPYSAVWDWYGSASGDGVRFQVPSFICHHDWLLMQGTVTGDLNYLETLYLNLRSVR